MKHWKRKRSLNVKLTGFAGLVFVILQFFGVQSIVTATDVSVTLLEAPQSIIVEPESPSINMGETQQFTATAVFADLSTLDVTNNIYTTWDSADINIATVNSTGLADSVSPGLVSINATYGGVTGSALLEINGPLTIDVDPVAVNMTIGSTRQFTATATFPDASTRVLNGDPDLFWESLNIGIATIDSDGLATGVSSGTTKIQATYFGVTGQATLHVMPVTPPSGPPGGGAGGSVTPPEKPPVEPPPEEVPPEEVPPEEVPPEEVPPEEVPPAEVPPSEQPQLPPIPPAEPLPRPQPLLPPPPAPGEEEFAEPLPPVTTEVIVPVTEEEQIALEEEELPDEMGVTRGEVMEFLNDKFDFAVMYKDLLDRCYNDLDGCLSIFLGVTNYSEVMLDPNYCTRDTAGDCMLTDPPYDISNSQLYPDVPPENVFYYYDITLGTMLAIVQGYYEDPQSPFRPYQIISRIEALKVILGSVDMIEWLYYDEVEALLGGEEGVKAQKTQFTDIDTTDIARFWYPRYANLACQVDIVDCAPGSRLRPDDYITEAEFFDMLDRLGAFMDKTGYLDNMLSDQDKDELIRFIETDIFFTDPVDQDTDDDQLGDGVEVYNYLTNPFMKDSDYEGLSDYDEVIVYKTDPLDQDTDDDNYSDFIEITTGSDPLDPESYPADADGNGIADAWEQLYGVTVDNGFQDTDGDGLSDAMEFRYNTDPTKFDTDGDGLSDADEILAYRTDPNDPGDPGNFEDLGVRITNFRENQLVADSTPLVKGTGPIGAAIELVLKNDYGHERVLGKTVVDENYIWIFEAAEPIRDGRYILMARALQPELKKVTESVPIHIVIDSTLNVAPPKPKKISDVDITEEDLLRNVRVTIRDNRPVVFGETEFGNEVTATWRSVVLSSAIIADSVTGEFEIESPQLMDIGNHEVYVTATRRNDEAQSETVKVLFNVSAPSLAVELRGAEALPGIWDTFKEDWLLWLLLLAAVIAIAGSAGYYYFVIAKGKKEEDQSKGKR